MKAIFLTGFMGSGKTTVGRMLSSYLHIPVIDTDEMIVARTGLSIKSIFNLQGEPYFRELEKNTLCGVPTKDIIVTTGGGIVIDKENRDWMKQNGLIIYLHCEFNEIWQRLYEDVSRPLLVNQDKTQIESIYNSRQSAYQEYHFMVDTTNITLDEITRQIGKWIKGANN